MCVAKIHPSELSFAMGEGQSIGNTSSANRTLCSQMIRCVSMVRQAIRLSESHYPVLFRCAGHAADGIGLQFLKACAADA